MFPSGPSDHRRAALRESCGQVIGRFSCQVWPRRFSRGDREPNKGFRACGWQYRSRSTHCSLLYLSVASSMYTVITAVISHLITHGSTDPP
jgi:hypothetical protein